MDPFWAAYVSLHTRVRVARFRGDAFQDSEPWFIVGVIGR